MDHVYVTGLTKQRARAFLATCETSGWRYCACKERENGWSFSFDLLDEVSAIRFQEALAALSHPIRSTRDADCSILQHILSKGAVEHQFSLEFILSVCRRAESIFQSESSLVDIGGAFTVVGDVQGQYADLMEIFKTCGRPGPTRYLFLGGFVGDGKHSLEVVILLFLCKIHSPKDVHLLRGHHEVASFNRSNGFLLELRLRYSTRNESEVIYETINKVFSWLPVAAVYSNKILCLPGGLPTSVQSLKDVKNLERGSVEPSGLMRDILVQGIIKETISFSSDDSRREVEAISTHNDALGERCKKLGVLMVVRSQQVVRDGREFSNKNKLLTLCSSPGSDTHYFNHGAVMRIDSSHNITFQQFSQQHMLHTKKRGLHS